MDSKNIKGTPRQFTKNPSLNTGPAITTANPLPALKNTSAKAYWAHDRGLNSEKFVQQHYQNKKYHLLQQRLKTPFAEVDLLFRSPDGRHLLLVEVKTANQGTFYSARITSRQKYRLLGAASFLAERYRTLVEVHWAFVTKTGEVTIIEDVS
ncbi:MAG: YraN family protein [Bacillota bacterium]